MNMFVFFFLVCCCVYGRENIQVSAYPPYTKMLISSGRLQFRPSYENCSVYLNLEDGEDGDKVSMTFREEGSVDWRRALDPVFMPGENACRGSIFNLRENTSWEVRLVLGEKSLEGKFRTLNSNVNIAKTVVIESLPFEFKESGEPDNYIRYTAKGPLLGQGGQEAVIKLTNLEYLLFDDIIIEANGARHGILVKECNHIIVRNCDISGFGRAGVQRIVPSTARSHLSSGQFVDRDGKRINYDAGVYLLNGHNILIERNYIHHPANQSNSWAYSHPAGPNAIFVWMPEGGAVLRYNDFVSNDAHRWNDVVESGDNGSIDGGFTRDSDIYGNLFFGGNDDSIELEGGGMNVRCYLNRMENSFCGTSTGSIRLGPCYIVRNLYTHLGDVRGYVGSAFKNGLGGLDGRAQGALFFFNNTDASERPTAFTNFYHSPPGDLPLPKYKAVTRNNIFNPGSRVFEGGWRVDFDYDLLHVTGGWTPLVKNAVAKYEQEKNGFFAVPVWHHEESGDFRLAPASPGYGTGLALADFPITHQGAFQEDGIDQLPYRPLPVRFSSQIVTFHDDKVLNQTLKCSTSSKDFKAAFTAHLSDDFFKVVPSSGEFVSGENLEFQVVLDETKMLYPKRYSGVIVFRTREGLSRPVSVYAQWRHIDRLRAALMQKVIFLPVGNGNIQIPSDGVYYPLAHACIDHSCAISLVLGEQKLAPNSRLQPQRGDGMPETFGVSSSRRPEMELKAGEYLYRLEIGDPKVEGLYLTTERELFYN